MNPLETSSPSRLRRRSPAHAGAAGHVQYDDRLVLQLGEDLQELLEMKMFPELGLGAMVGVEEELTSVSKTSAF